MITTISRHKRQLEYHMENLTGGTPPVRYLLCVVPCKLYFFYVQSLFPKCPLVFSTYRIFMAHCSIYVKMEKGLQPGKFS